MLTTTDITHLAEERGIHITHRDILSAIHKKQLTPAAKILGDKIVPTSTKSGHAKNLYPHQQVAEFLMCLTGTTHHGGYGWLTTHQVTTQYGKPPRQLLGKNYNMVERKGHGSATTYRESDIMALGYERIKRCIRNGCNNPALPGQEYGFSFCETHMKNYRAITRTAPDQKTLAGLLAHLQTLKQGA